MSKSRLAFRRMAPSPFGAESFTPKRRASDKPTATAWRAERIVPLPSWNRRISAFTNSPACVDGLFPWRASRRARSIAALTGIVYTIGPGDDAMVPRAFEGY
jgi:hypothetical protein